MARSRNHRRRLLHWIRSGRTPTGVSNRATRIVSVSGCDSRLVEACYSDDRSSKMSQRGAPAAHRANAHSCLVIHFPLRTAQDTLAYIYSLVPCGYT